jgi:hypothetical protein
MACSEVFRRHVGGPGITEVRFAAHAPWQNPYVERLIGSMRGEWGNRSLA